MKGAVIVTPDANFLDDAASALRGLGFDPVLKGDVLQVSDNEGHLLTIYRSGHDLKELIPDFDSLKGRELLRDRNFGHLVDCRWEDLFCRVMKGLTGAGTNPFFIVDNANVIWEPATLDPRRIHL